MRSRSSAVIIPSHQQRRHGDGEEAIRRDRASQYHERHEKGDSGVVALLQQWGIVVDRRIRVVGPIVTVGVIFVIFCVYHFARDDVKHAGSGGKGLARKKTRRSGGGSVSSVDGELSDLLDAVGNKRKRRGGESVEEEEEPTMGQGTARETEEEGFSNPTAAIGDTDRGVGGAVVAGEEAVAAESVILKTAKKQGRRTDSGTTSAAAAAAAEAIGDRMVEDQGKRSDGQPAGGNAPREGAIPRPVAGVAKKARSRGEGEEGSIDGGGEGGVLGKLSRPMANYLFGASLLSERATGGGGKGRSRDACAAQSITAVSSSTSAAVVGHTHRHSNSRVPPRIFFDNVFTSPLPLIEQMGLAGRDSLETADAGDDSADAARQRGGAHRMKRNKILSLYADIDPSPADDGPALFVRGDDGPPLSASSSSSSSSAFFDLMDRGMYSLHPMRRVLADYLIGAEKNSSTAVEEELLASFLHASRAKSLRGAPRGYWSRHRPLLRDLLQRYQTFHREGMRRLRERLGNGRGGGGAVAKGKGGASSSSSSSSSSLLPDDAYHHYVVVRPVGQLCNRLVAITSAFVFALMTRRVLLIDDADFYCTMDDLFVVPGFEWIFRGRDVAVGGDSFGSSSSSSQSRGRGTRRGSSSAPTSSSLSALFEQGHLVDFTALDVADDFKVKRNNAISSSTSGVNPKYGYAPPASHNPFLQSPLGVLEDAYGPAQHGAAGGGRGGLRAYTIENPEHGQWSETDTLLCSEDYRRSYKSSSGDVNDGNGNRAPAVVSPSVVSFTVNQYLVPYYYRNPNYHGALVELFGPIHQDTNKKQKQGEHKGEGDYDLLEAVANERDDVFNPIAHFLFRPLPSILRARDTFIKKNFFDSSSSSSIPSYVVGLQVRSGGDFTDHFMTERDWHLYRDCGLQTSPHDVLLPTYTTYGDGDGEVAGADAGPSAGAENDGSPIGGRRRFKFYVATDTDKGRVAARAHLGAFPDAAHSIRTGSSGADTDSRSGAPTLTVVRNGRRRSDAGAQSPSPSSIPILFGPGEFKLSNNPDGVRAALLDLLLLAAADDRVQTAWSSFGYFASGISGVNGNIVVNKAPAIGGGGGGQHASSCWVGEDAGRMSLLHGPTLAKHKARLALKGSSSVAQDNAEKNGGSGTGADGAIIVGIVESSGHLAEEANTRLLRDYIAAHSGNHPGHNEGQRSGSDGITIALQGPSVGSEAIRSSSSSSAPVAPYFVLSYGLVESDEEILQRKQHGAGEGGPRFHALGNAQQQQPHANTRASEQRFMGIMHKSDKRVQCVRTSSHEPCFHKFASWGAAESRCHDWGRMTYPEMLRGGRYC